jgi:hypothetical protein
MGSPRHVPSPARPFRGHRFGVFAYDFDTNHQGTGDDGSRQRYIRHPWVSSHEDEPAPIPDALDTNVGDKSRLAYCHPAVLRGSPVICTAARNPMDRAIASAAPFLVGLSLAFRSHQGDSPLISAGLTGDDGYERRTLLKCVVWA